MSWATSDLERMFDDWTMAWSSNESFNDPEKVLVTYTDISKTFTARLSLIPRSSNSSAEVQIDAKGIWTGVKERDDHLRSADFLDVDHHPEITFAGNQVEV